MPSLPRLSENRGADSLCPLLGVRAREFLAERLAWGRKQRPGVCARLGVAAFQENFIYGPEI